MLTPMKSIRAKCIDCCCGQAQEVRLCPASDCPLYPYRMGHNPNRAGIGKKISAQGDGTERDDTEEGTDMAEDLCAE